MKSPSTTDLFIDQSVTIAEQDDYISWITASMNISERIRIWDVDGNKNVDLVVAVKRTSIVVSLSCRRRSKLPL